MNPPARHGRHLALLAGGLLVLALGWVAAPAGVPLFDGVGFPDEPYRYVHPGPGQATKLPPSVASMSFDVASGSNPQGEELASNEQGPQVLLYVPANSLIRPDGGGATVTVTATPTAADAEVPPNGVVTGDVYRVTAQDDDQPVSLSSGTSGTITLRAPVGFKVIPVIDFRTGPGAAWHLVQTSKVGNDIFEAPMEELGDYATVLPTNGVKVTAPNSHLLVKLLAILVGLCVVGLVIVRGMRVINDTPERSWDDDDDDE